MQVPAVTKTAHTYGRRSSAARYDPRIPEPELKSFANVILLCAEHHDSVDGSVTRDDYPATLLNGGNANARIWTRYRPARWTRSKGGAV
jgi:hypothetical protein